MTLKIENNTKAAWMFFRPNFAGTYRSLGSTTVTQYTTPHLTDPKDFKNLYLGRIYCQTYGWTQVGGSLNWGYTPNLNTSVWDTAATLSTTAAIAGKLRIHPSSASQPEGRLKILPGGQLTCYDSTIIQSVNGLWIVTSTNGGADGSFIDNGTIVYGSGASAYVERYLSQDSWHTFCMPITNTIANTFKKLYMKWYDEPNHNYVYITTINNLDSVIASPMNGYFMWSSSNTTGNATVKMSGPLNTAPASAPITMNLTRSVYPPAPGYQYDGWNFIGNPFASGTDIQSFGWTFTDLDPVIYTFDGSVYKSYNRETHVGSGSRYLSPMQGFFVHVDTVPSNNASGSISVHNASRIHYNGPYLKETPVLDDLLILNTDGNGISDEAWINFNMDATIQFDPQYDAYKLFGVTEAPQLYSILPGNLASINVLPWTSINQVIPLGFTCGLSGNYTITASNLNSFRSGVKVYLEDTKNPGVMQDLMINPTYQFDYVAGESANRFILHFTNNYFGISESTAGSFQIYSNENIVYIKNNSTSTTKGQVYIYDISGREIYRSLLQNTNINKYSIDVVQGYYFVKLITPTESFNQKVYLK